jgi:hypothetical protein
MSDNTGSNFNSAYLRCLSTDFDAVCCLVTSAQCPVRIHREIRYGSDCPRLRTRQVWRSTRSPTSDIALTDFGSFRIRSAISVRSIGDLTAVRPNQSRYVMFAPPVLADYYTKPRGAVVLRSSTPCTLAYLTELLPTFTNFRLLLVVTWTIVIFRFLASAFSVFARQSPFSRSDLADLTAVRPYQSRYVMLGPPVLAGC